MSKRIRIFSALSIFLLVSGLFLVPAPARAGTPFRVYLTFEDGPTDAYTPAILDLLAQYNAKATFFVAGAQIKGHEGVLQREIREGHAIGNHLWVEPGLYIGAPDDAVIASYIKTEDAIRAALGPELPRYDAQTKLFRQPAGGAKRLPGSVGVQVVTYNWQVSGDDCGRYIDFKNTLNFDQQVVLNVLGKSRFHDPAYNNVYDFGDGVVVVFHDINRVTGRVLPQIVHDLSEAGATFLALPRPEDAPGTMPIRLGDRPNHTPGIPNLTLPATITEYTVGHRLPSSKSSVNIASIPPKTSLMAVGRAEGWIQISYNAQTAWVSAAQIRVSGPIPSLPLITLEASSKPS